jgi:protein-disulfide isomerase
VLGAEKDIIERYVDTGKVKIVFHPITDIGTRAVDAQAAAFCVGEQGADLYWTYHDLLYENYDATYRGDRAYFLEKATSIGADGDAWGTCYDSGEFHTLATNLNTIRKEEGIRNRPTYVIGETVIVGAQPFTVFEQAIEEALP